MGGFETSIIGGFLRGFVSVWLVYYIDDRSTQKEKELSLPFLNGAKRD